MSPPRASLMPSEPHDPLPERERAAATGEAPAFVIATDGGGLVCEGERARLESVGGDELPRRTAEFFARAAQGPKLLVGAIPFDPRDRVAIFQPRASHRLDSGRSIAATSAPLELAWSLISAGVPAEYRAAVASAVELIERSKSARGNARLDKIVLARSIELEVDRPVDVARVVRYLARDRRIAAFLTPLPPAAGVRDGAHDGTRDAATGQRYLVGASPELLVAKAGAKISSRPLAGSARRSRSQTEDAAAARMLVDSEKDRREHRAVAEAVLDTLAPYCAQLLGESPVLASTNSMWHLGTRIEGRLRDPETPCMELVAALHPTPAVCGFPREAARAAIESLETFDRGFYAGAVGWTDAAGDGAWHVSIRCADIAERRVRLYAGAGIVEGSDPLAETRETAAKFAALLEALGVDERELREVLEGHA